MSVSFSCEEYCDETLECAWYNKTSDIWQNEGCNKEIDYEINSIRCSCNHLTTFATIHNIHSFECEFQDNDYIAEWLRSKVWNVVTITMAVLFLCISLFTIKEIYPFFYRATREVTFETHRSVYAVILIGIAAFLYMLAYVQAYITKIVIQNGVNFNPNIAIKIYSLLLLLPQVVLFMLFTLIFYTWFGLAHSFMKEIEDAQKRVRNILIAINIFIWCFLVVYYVLIFGRNDTIFHIAAYIWSVMLSIAAIFVTVYSILVGRVLYKAARISQDQHFAHRDHTVVRRLLIINAFLTLYFVFQAFTTIYLAIHPEYQTVVYSTLYSFMDVFCLLVIFWMYRDSLQHLKEENGFKRTQSNTLTAQYLKNSNTSENAQRSQCQVRDRTNTHQTLQTQPINITQRNTITDDTSSTSTAAEMTGIKFRRKTFKQTLPITPEIATPVIDGVSQNNDYNYSSTVPVATAETTLDREESEDDGIQIVYDVVFDVTKELDPNAIDADDEDSIEIADDGDERAPPPMCMIASKSLVLN